MNPILQQQLSTSLEQAALATYLESLDISIEQLMADLPNMSEDEVEKFMAGFQIYLDETKNAFIEESYDMLSKDNK